MATTRTAAARTPSVEAILDALRQRPGATATELAETAGVGRSTAGKALATLEAQGRVARQRGASEGGRPAPDLWTLVRDRAGHAPQPAAKPAADRPAAAAPAAAPTGGEALPATSTPDTGTAEQATGPASQAGAGTDQPADTSTRSGPRLRPGALRGLVKAWLAERPGQAFSPTRIAKELGRSAGAVGNALATMAAQGQVTQTSRKPRRYATAKRGDQAATTR